ncbi:hypothetical protein D3C85_1393120 [compost metagenome]
MFNPHVDFQLDRSSLILRDISLNVLPTIPVHANVLVQIFHLKGLSVPVPEFAENEMSIVVAVHPHPDFLGQAGNRIGSCRAHIHIGRVLLNSNVVIIQTYGVIA